MGTPQAAVPCLDRLVRDGHEIVAAYTQPDRPAGRGQKIVFSPVKLFAIESDIPVFQPAKIRTPEALDTFKSHDADLAVVVAYGRILPDGFLTAFPRGAVNVHFSLLPKYRGAAPVNWAIAEGETETGVTTMKMDAGLDTGDILLQWPIAIGEGEDAVELMSRLAELGADILSETLSDLPSIHPRKQDHSRATLAPILKKEDGRIDWYLNSQSLANRIRGFQPFPGSFTDLHGKRLKIWKAQAVTKAEFKGRPGEVVAADSSGLLVACGEGVLQLIEVQPEGKNRQSISDFLNGFRVTIGEILGR